MVSRIRLLPGLLLLSLLFAGPVTLNGQETQKTQETCDGPYKGRRLSPEELADVLALHRKWLGNTPGGQQANFCEAVLGGENLQGAYLVRTDLRAAGLIGANLAEANLRK
jgi:hypothetical protein